MKSKTDTHFYAPSIKAPSSKPPLSRKSNSSKGKDSKVSVIKKNTPSKASQIDKNQKPKEPKKMNLIELAMQKKYEDSRSNSQCSFDSRESFSSK